MKEGICKSRFCSIKGNSRKELGVFSINLSSEASEVESYQQYPKERAIPKKLRKVRACH